VFYLLKVYALVAVAIFSATGLFILALFVWFEAKAYAAAQLRVLKRLASLTNPLAISRTSSRPHDVVSLTPHKTQ